MNKKFLCAFLTAALLLPSQAFANEQEIIDDIIELDEVTVTARKVKESAKDVPFTLSVVSGDDLTNRNIRNFEDMLKQTVGVEVSTFGGVDTAIVRMRGVGSLQQASPDDTSVIINIDGVPQTIGSATLSTMDIEQVEILKGPQGTLMGRNSQSGAINIVTKKPTRDFEGYLRGEYGSENTYLTEGALSGPITGTLSGRLALRYGGNDHQVKYYRTDDPVTKPNDFAVRGSLLWQPAAATSALLIVSHEEVNDRFFGDVLKPYDRKQETDISRNFVGSDKDADRISLEINHELSKATFTSVTGYGYVKVDDPQYIYNGILYRKLMGMTGEGGRTLTNRDKAYNQEFRLSSKPEDKVFWVTGVNFFYIDRDSGSGKAHESLDIEGWYNAEMMTNFKTRSSAVFGEATYPVTSRLKLTGGLRYTWEKKEYDSEWTANPANPNPVRHATDKGDITDEYMTGRLALGYGLTKELNLYAVYARGHKTGGFNEWATGFIDGSKDDRYYKEAEVDSYEVGFKYEASSRKYGMSGSVFYNDNKDDHVMLYNPVDRVFNIENFDTDSKGVEFEGFARFGGLTLSAGVGYTDAKITSVPSDSLSVAKKGNKVPDTAKWNATIGATYFHNLPAFWIMENPVFFTRITDRYVGSRAGDTEDNFELEAYHKLDAKIGIINGGFEAYIWADNLLDEYYDLYGWYYGQAYDDGSDVVVGMPAKGRTIGVGAAYYF